jgi:hypothetical protein
MHSTISFSTSRLLAPAFATLRRVLAGRPALAITPGVLSDHELKQIVADLIG